MSTINKPFRKKDAMQLVTGQPVYMDDVCLLYTSPSPRDA